MRYRKIGKGRLLRCYKDRIKEDYTIKEGNKVFCPNCGNLFGIDYGAFIKVRKGSFTQKGSYE
ncbi:hypothetical protein [Hippea maritima]|nr:hypothetical protein [Hippea maritima]